MTKNELKVCFAAATEIIRELGEVPAGHIYAALMSRGLILDEYNFIEKTIIDIFKVVKEPSYLLRWTPESEEIYAATRSAKT